MDVNQKKKYRNAVLYFVQHCNNQYLGDTKLNKLLYYLDFVHYRDTGKSVTGASYHHLQFGPVPHYVQEIVHGLVREGGLEKKEILFEKGGHKVQYHALKQPSLSVFTKRERDLLTTICRTFKGWSTRKIVGQTHFEAPWFFSKPGEKIRYAYAKDIDII